ncbi:MAG: protein phosphatase CheZ [Burkholderiaceae bacterium]|jgi:chemotaxis protein CheZ
MQSAQLKSGDSEDLEALFDSVAAQRQEVTLAAVSQTMIDHDSSEVQGQIDAQDPGEVYQRLGSLTRKLHDAMRELGYDRSVENAVNALPDARTRLAYIADLTGKAAEKVLGLVDKTQAIQDEMIARAKALDLEWSRLFNHEMTLDEFKAHALQTHEFLKTVQDKSHVTNAGLTEIMMAQDFHDLTGQVINRVAGIAQNVEEQLVQLLIDTTPAEKRPLPSSDSTWLSGPAVQTEGRTDICADQAQVDDLLESLGF